MERYSDQEFLCHFRIGRNIVLGELTNKFACSEWYTNLHKHANSRANISASKHILVFLWFAGHQTSSYRYVADRFNLSLSSLYDVITRVMSFLSAMAPHVIKFPSATAQQKTINYYYQKNGFPNVIGSIDGTHIRIDKPVEHHTDYFNREDYYSIILQGLCDADLNFLDIFIGYPGSVHDARVFRNSSLFSKLDNFCKDGYILGDSAYPLLQTEITPYRDNGRLTAAQKNFNKSLSSCRVSIEHCFGILKQRFRQLYHLKLKGHERICHFIRACCVLHNIANKDDILCFNQEDKVEDIQPDSTEITNPQESGSALRDEICRQLLMRRR